MPGIISSLVAISSTIVSANSFGTDKGVYKRGYDGYTSIEGSLCTYMPNGDAIWEVKCRQKFSTIKDDYQKRTNEVEEIRRKQTTYVAVYVGIGQIDWDWHAKIKAKEEWKDVKILCLEGLTKWLSLYPIVLLNDVSYLLGLKLEGTVRDAMNLLRDHQSNYRQDEINMQIAGLANQDEFINVIYDWYEGDRAETLIVIANTKKESIALYVQALHSKYNYSVPGCYGWAVVDEATWNQYTDNNGYKSAIIIPMHKEYDYSMFASKQGHSLFVPMAYSEETNSQARKLIEKSVIAVWTG